MSNLKLIATQTDKQIYDITKIAENLSWVLPDTFINSSSSNPEIWNQYNKINDLANLCTSTQKNQKINCSLLYDQLILVNPGAVPLGTININGATSGTVVVSGTGSGTVSVSVSGTGIPSVSQEYVINTIYDVSPNETNDDDTTMYIFIGIIVLIFGISGGLVYYESRKKSIDLELSEFNENIGSGGFFNRGE